MFNLVILWSTGPNARQKEQSSTLHYNIFITSCPKCLTIRWNQEFTSYIPMYHSYVVPPSSTATRTLNANYNPSALIDPDDSASKSRSGLAWDCNAASRYNSIVSESLYCSPFNLSDIPTCNAVGRPIAQLLRPLPYHGSSRCYDS